MSEKYSVQDYTVEQILNFIKSNEIAIPEVANFTYLDTPTNILVGKDEPRKYFSKVLSQCKTGEYKIGNLKTEESIKKNFADNCIPEDIVDWTFKDYEQFLSERRKMMVKKIRSYYQKL